MKKYYTSYRGSQWRFHCKIKDKEGKSKLLYLKKASDTKIRRHMKIAAKATTFDPIYKEYFERREKQRKRLSLLSHKTKLAGLKIIQPF